MINIFFQQTALIVLMAQTRVDICRLSGSFSQLGDFFVDDEDNSDSIKLPRMRPREQPKIELRPAPTKGCFHDSGLSFDHEEVMPTKNKPKKTVSFGSAENLYRVRLMPKYTFGQKRTCFYSYEEIKKFRFEKFMEENADEFEIVDSDDEDSEYSYEWEEVSISENGEDEDEEFVEEILIENIEPFVAPPPLEYQTSYP